MELSVDPITLSVGLIEADLDTVASAFMEWSSGVLSKHGMRLVSRGICMPPIDAFSRLSPLSTSVPTRYLLLEGHKWTAYFDNLVRGPDPTGAMKVLGRRLDCRSVRALHRANAASNQTEASVLSRFGATILEVYSAGDFERVVSVANDGGKWVFHESGDAYSFEDTDSYRKRVIADRFTKDLLGLYLMHLGAAPFTKDWYSGSGVLFKKVGNLPEGLQLVPLDKLASAFSI